MKPPTKSKTENKRESAIASGAAYADLMFERGFEVSSLRCDPLWNMALDNWLAESAPLGAGELALRVYRWKPGAITIGRNQSWERALDYSKLQGDETAIRRITGGRAIFHDPGEITYAIVYQGDTTNASTLSPAQAREISLHIAIALELALRNIGKSATLQRRSGVSAHRRTVNVAASSELASSCFASTARHELIVDGAKVAAGAQRIFGARFFQHGSIKLSGVAVHAALGRGPESAGRRGDSDNIMLQNKLDLKSAFADVFGISLLPLELSSAQNLEVESGIGRLDRLVGCESGYDFGDETRRVRTEEKMVEGV